MSAQEKAIYLSRRRIFAGSSSSVRKLIRAARIEAGQRPIRYDEPEGYHFTKGWRR